MNILVYRTDRLVHSNVVKWER